MSNACGERLFGFVPWNDVHLTAPMENEHLRGMNVRAQWLRGRMAGWPEMGRADFIASLGDLVHGSTEDHWIELMEAYIKPLGIAVLPCAGNHDNRGGTDNTNYDRYFGPGWRNYCYAHSGVGFVVIDSSNTRTMSAEHSRRSGEFFERAMRHLGEMPVFVLTHTPLLTVRDEEVFVKSFPHKSYKQLFPELLEAVNVQRERVIGVLAGHVHLSGVRHEKGIAHIVPCGTATYPCEFASVDVYEDRVHVRMWPVPEGIVKEPTLRNLHGPADGGVAFTDSTHGTGEAYLRGNPDERDFWIGLLGKKKPVAGAERRLKVWHASGDGFVEREIGW